jgi:hypothetical protein
VDESELDQLAASIRRLTDKDEIRELIARYSMAIDLNLSRELLELFTDDCVISYGGQEPLVGRDQLRARREGSRGMTAASHHNAAVQIWFDGHDAARGIVSLYAWQIISGEPVEVWGYYFDEYRRTADGWRFSSRRLKLCGHDGYTAPYEPVDRREGFGL